MKQKITLTYAPHSTKKPTGKITSYISTDHTTKIVKTNVRKIFIKLINKDYPTSSTTHNISTETQ